MKIYNVIIETNDTDSSGEILLDFTSFKNRESARKFLMEKYRENTKEMSKEEKCSMTNSSDYWEEFTVYFDDSCDEWSVRGRVFETEFVED